MSVAQDVAINAGASALCGFLALQELKGDTGREEQREEGALIGRLTVWLQTVDPAAEAALVRLSDVRASRGGRSRRPVLCIGDLDFCLACVESSAKLAAAMDRADLLLVPALTSSGTDRALLVEAAKGLDFVALPPERSSNWDALCSMQAAKVRGQGLDGAKGQVVIIKKNGRVATRFLGVPNWAAIAGEIGSRLDVGLDTTNI